MPKWAWQHELNQYNTTIGQRINPRKIGEKSDLPNHVANKCFDSLAAVFRDYAQRKASVFLTACRLGGNSGVTGWKITQRGTTKSRNSIFILFLRTHFTRQTRWWTNSSYVIGWQWGSGSLLHNPLAVINRKRFSCVPYLSSKISWYSRTYQICGTTNPKPCRFRQSE